MDTRTQTLGLIHFQLECISTALEMNLLFPAVEFSIHHVVVKMPQEYAVEDRLSQVQVLSWSANLISQHSANLSASSVNLTCTNNQFTVQMPIEGLQ